MTATHLLTAARSGWQGSAPYRGRLLAIIGTPLQTVRCLFARFSGDREQRKQIVVCGYPRGGTSLLYNMLSVSLEKFVFDRFEVSALSSLWRFQNHCSKMPIDVLELPELARRNVHRKEIHALVVVRDIRDVLTSIHPNAPDRYLIDYDGRWSIQGAYPYRLRRVATGVREIHNAIRRASHIHPIRAHQVRYEDLVSDADAVQRKLEEALGVTFSQAFSRFHLTPERHAYRYEGRWARAVDPSRVRENGPVDISRRGKWRDPQHRSRIIEQFSDYPELFEILRQDGYEPDDSWFAALVAANSGSNDGP